MVDDTEHPKRSSSQAVEVGAKLFKLRDYTPIPLIVLLLVFAHPGVRTATLGTLLVVLGELIRIYSVAFIGTISRTRGLSTTGGALVTTGPFGVVRNPLYVGNFFITLGILVFGGSLGVLVVGVLLFAAQYYFIVKFEEDLLLQKFGRQYDDYRAAVPAWFPRRMPGLNEIEWPTDYSHALRSERRTLTAIVAMLVVLCFFA